MPLFIISLEKAWKYLVAKIQKKIQSMVQYKNKVIEEICGNSQHVAVYRSWRPSGLFFRWKFKNIFRYAHGECMYQILGFYRFSLAWWLKHKPTLPTNQQLNKQINKSLPPARMTWIQLQSRSLNTVKYWKFEMKINIREFSIKYSFHI